MCPMVTLSREAAQRPAPTTSKGGWAGRCGLQCFLRIRPECPKCNQRELTWASKPDCGIATMQKALT